MNGTGDYHVQRSKTGSEGQNLHVLSHMQNLHKIEGVSGRGKERRKENDGVWGEQYQNTLYLCMKTAQGNSLKV
jgi:hypothetical protein